MYVGWDLRVYKTVYDVVNLCQYQLIIAVGVVQLLQIEHNLEYMKQLGLS